MLPLVMLAGKKVDPTATLPEGQKGETRDKVAEAVGMKARTYEKAKAVYEAAKAGDVKAAEVLTKLDAGGMAVNLAYKVMAGTAPLPALTTFARALQVEKHENP